MKTYFVHLVLLGLLCSVFLQAQPANFNSLIKQFAQKESASGRGLTMGNISKENTSIPEETIQPIPDKRSASLIVQPSVPGRLEKANILFSGAEAPQELTLEIRNGKVFWNHDIVLFSEEEYELKKLEKGNIIAWGFNRWPDGIIPYVISPNNTAQSLVQDAIAYLNANTNLCLVPRTNQSNYIEFIDREEACWSPVGMRVGRQEVNIHPDCGFGAAVHEILHSAGMWHEQSRNDRDTYVRILFENIEGEMMHNFEKKGGNISHIGPYDYSSIMHYGAFIFSKNGQPTISVNMPPAAANTQIGYIDALSQGDLASINTTYPVKSCASSPVASSKISLFAPVTINPSPVIAGRSFTISTNFINKGTTTFKGCYYAAIFDSKGEEVVAILPEIRETEGLQPSFRYNNNLTFTSPGLNVPSGIYLAVIFYRDNCFGDYSVAGNEDHPSIVAFQVNTSATPTLSVTPASLSFAANGENKTFSVSSNTNWTVSESLSWLSVSPSSGSNNGSVTVTAQANTSTSSRTGTISVSASGAATQTITVSQGAASSLAVSPNALNFTANGGNQAISITSNTNWTLSSTASWLTFSPASGSNDRSVSVTASAHTGSSSRSAVVTISGTGVSSQTVSVTQTGVPASCTAPSNVRLDRNGYSWFVVNWDTVPGVTAYSWRIRLANETAWTSTNDNWSATNVVSPNRFPCTEYVFQVRAVCGGVFGPWSPELLIKLDGCGDPYCYSYGIANNDWMARVDFANIANVSGRTYGYGNFTQQRARVERGGSYPITLFAAHNSSSQNETYFWNVWIDWNQDGDFADAGERAFSQSATRAASVGGFQGNIAIPATAMTGLTRMRVALSMTGTTDPCAKGTNRDIQDYSVEISAPSMSLSISPSTLSFLSSGETKTLSVSSNTSWTASSSQTWLSLSPSSGSNNGSISVIAQPNTSTSSRSATITVSGTGALTQTVSVTQAGAAPALTVSPASLSFAAGGESKTVAVSTSGNWTVSSFATWLSVSPISGSGNQTFSVTAQANTGSIARNAAITVVGTGGASQTISVMQAVRTDSLDVQPASLRFSANADTQTVRITGNMNWTASNAASWLNLDKTAGTGNGDLRISASANTSVQERSATVTIRGGSLTRTVMVVQDPAGSSALPASWTFKATENSHTIILTTSLISDIEGKTIAVGDYIGIFFQQDGKDICAGHGAWTGRNASFPVFGDDSATPGKDGLSAGELFRVKIWQAAAQQELDAVAVFAPVGTQGIVNATDRYLTDGFSMLTSIKASKTETLVIPLKESWNMVSSYLVPEMADLEGLLRGVPAVQVIKDGVGKTYITDLQINGIGDWKITEGYRIRAASETELRMVGKPVEPQTTPVPIRAGWQIIPVFSRAPQPLTEALAGILNLVEVVKDNKGQVYLADFGIDGIGMLAPTQGYRLLAKGPGELRFGQEGMLPTRARVWGDLLAGSATDTMQHFRLPEGYNTGANATLVLLAAGAGDVLQPGDEIGIFAGDTLLCGAAKYAGVNLAITVWGDDTALPGRQGMLPGERYQIAVWKRSEHKSYPLLPVFAQGKDQYQEDDVAVIQSVSLLTTSLLERNEDHAILVFPNPSDGHLTLLPKVSIPGAAHVRISNVSGQVVWQRRYPDGLSSGSPQQIQLPGTLPNGVYAVQIQNAESVWVRKVLISR